MGLTEEDLSELQATLLLDPASGDVIEGLHGARKLRVRAKDHGKRGGGRVIYVDVVIHEQIYLLLAYAKNEAIDLSPQQKRTLNALISRLKE